MKSQWLKYLVILVVVVMFGLVLFCGCTAQRIQQYKDQLLLVEAKLADIDALIATMPPGQAKEEILKVRDAVAADLAVLNQNLQEARDGFAVIEGIVLTFGKYLPPEVAVWVPVALGLLLGLIKESLTTKPKLLSAQDAVAGLNTELEATQEAQRLQTLASEVMVSAIKETGAVSTAELIRERSKEVGVRDVISNTVDKLFANILTKAA